MALRVLPVLKRKLRYTFLLPVLVILLACSHQVSPLGANQFKLTGKTRSMPDGTMLYLTETLSNKEVDSMQIMGNAFHAKGYLIDWPTNFYLHTKDYDEYVSLWLEPGHMTFDASSSDFRHAIITGSQTQAEASTFLEAIANIESDDDTEQTEQLAMEFIRTHPGNRLSASMLAGYSPEWGKERVKELYEPFTLANKESEYGKRILQYITLNQDHNIGDRYSDFEMKDTEGHQRKLSDHLGKVTLLEFWASWCGPCRKQNPGLVQTYRKYHGRGFDIISVSLDFSQADWVKAIEQDSLTWLHVSDLKGRNNLAGIIYGVNAIPDNYLLDRNGVIIGQYLWGKDLEEAIEKSLQ